MSTPAIYDVALVGLGPTGAVLANLLGVAGLSVLVLEKEAGIHALPRAIHFDGEVMRVFQGIGLRDAVLAIARPGLEGMHFVDAQGETLFVRGGAAALGPHGCANSYYFHQPQLEALLRDGLARYPRVHVMLRHELRSITEAEGQVQLGAYDLASSADLAFAAKYVVGCDGARSAVRAHMGSEMVDLGLRQPWLVFDVLLQRELDLPAYTVQVCDPARPMTCCNVVGNRRRWEIMVLPGDDPAELVKPARLWELVAPWVTPQVATLERAAIYTFHSVLAHGWRKNRLLLAGDACHQTPPFLGQGMCAGIRDAANLGWKLAAVLRDGAQADLLDSYEAERAPHVQALIELAVRLGTIIQTTDKQQAADRDARFRAGEPQVVELPPSALGRLDTLDPTDPFTRRPFPQPRLRNGEWLDDTVGARFALIMHPRSLAAAPEAVRELLLRARVKLVDAADPALSVWLSENKVVAVMVRPDRYMLGVARTPAAIEALCARLPVAV